ncbi:MAG: DUF1501 domain-containing protein [Planctomycetaceae bacterium]|nr:DUF1501 domain-containing protein [Planctomycetaceae bacterium]
MLTNLSPTDITLSRRTLLQIGAPALGLGLADLLRLESRAADAGRPAPGKSLIVFWTDGGVSQQDTWDMKPDAPAEYRGEYRPIRTALPGVMLGERLEQQAAVMNRLSIVRSVHHENGIHAPSAHWMQTGYFGPTLARNAPQKPCFGSVISRALGSRMPPMPAYVTIPRLEAFGYQGAVYLGKAYNPFEVGADPNAKDFKVPNLTPPNGLTSRTVEARRNLLKSFDTLPRTLDDSGVMEGLDTFKGQALEMVAGDRMRAAFDLSAEDPRLRDRYGRHRYGQSALLARRLVEAGARCVNINTGNWDHHNNLVKGHDEHLPPLDRAIAALVLDLEERGRLDDTIIYCVGEFGRTPRINGPAGRDHWADCFRVLLAGGGIQGGRIVGASEKWGGGVQERLVTPQDLLATLYHLLGVPLDASYEDASGRPNSIVGSGRPIDELL